MEFERYIKLYKDTPDGRIDIHVEAETSGNVLDKLLPLLQSYRESESIGIRYKLEGSKLLLDMTAYYNVDSHINRLVKAQQDILSSPINPLEGRIGSPDD